MLCSALGTSRLLCAWLLESFAEPSRASARETRCGEANSHTSDGQPGRTVPSAEGMLTSFVSMLLRPLPCVRLAMLAAQAEGLAMKREPHTNRVPRSQRGGEVVEPLVRPCSECQGHGQLLHGLVLGAVDAEGSAAFWCPGRSCCIDLA